jgi:hypothetical protein
MDIEPQVTDADAKNNEGSNHATINGYTAHNSATPQRGHAPQNEKSQRSRLASHARQQEHLEPCASLFPGR